MACNLVLTVKTYEYICHSKADVSSESTFRIKFQKVVTVTCFKPENPINAA